jgi:two-component system sensor histidine kinase YesM
MKRGKVPLWYLNLPIRVKLFLWIFPLLILTIAMTGGFSYYVASNQVLNEISQSQENLTIKSIHQFDDVAQDAVDFTNYLFLSSNVQELLSSEDNPVIRRRTFSSISTLMVTRHSIHSLIIYKLNETTLDPFAINQTGITSAMPFEEFKETAIFKNALEANGEATWTILPPEQSLFRGDRQYKFILAKAIKNIYTLKNEGIVIVGINEAVLRDQYMKIIGSDAQMFMVDEEGRVLTASDPIFLNRNLTEIPYFQTNPSLQMGNLPENLNSENWIISHARSDLTGWHTFIIQSKRQLLQELDRIGLVTLAVMALCLVLSVIILWYASSILTEPLKKLVKSMRRLQTGDFTQRVHFNGEDEIGQVGHGYDKMVQRIKELIDDVYASELKQKQAELKTLQAQIHPHFLYNTLDTICWTAQKRGQTDIADMVYSLSQVFRLSLSDGKDFITIEQELELVKNYLALQQIRFQSRFTFEIETEPEILEFQVPKLLLQPVVENAIIHGIEPYQGTGFVNITAFYHNHGIQIQIMDNGVGIPPEQLEAIQQFILQDPEHEAPFGFALYNIKERLALAYGTRAAFNINSSVDKGTIVSVVIPHRRDEQL